MTEPISLDEAKNNLRIDSDDEDALIADLIVTAREYVEDETGLVLTPRTIIETGPRLGPFIDVSAWPVSSIVAVRYTAVDGTLTVLDPTAWHTLLTRRPIRIAPTKFNWGVQAYCHPVGNWGSHTESPPYLPIEVEMTAGFPTPADVPFKARQAMHLLIAHFYTNRSAVEAGARAAAVEMPIGVEKLLERLTLERI